ncbi:MAG: UvrD-helicase domain-containing protein [Patescibacteria group bacterium]|nr:UvrD-helicase domain-containing protein [Patescibacteria group bacterium]
MIDILENLNEQQKSAVLTTDGPVLVIAGPGSGKTRVLTHRIVHIISIEKTKPENILAVTFTNKAASEMKNRVTELINKMSLLDVFMGNRSKNYNSYVTSFPADFPTICTFHSLCVKILRKDAQVIGYKNDFVIFDTDDQKALVKKIMKRLEISDDQFNPKAVLAEISNAKNELVTPQKYENIVNGYFQETVSKIYTEYQKELKQTSSFDFDDLIMQTIVLFLNHKDILEKYQNKFKYIMVDEYQDTNHAQYKLVNLLSSRHKNIFVVGDDWQSIYKWRGADIKNILEFEKNYPGAKTILLEQNYRSTQEILDVSYGIISKNINRKEKNLFSSKKSGQRVVVYEAADEKGEAEYIVTQIAKLNTQKNLKLKDIAILYRTNAQSRSIEETFLRYNVPYKIVGGIKFYMRKEIKDLIAYFRLIQNNGDVLSFERIINVPKRGIGKSTYEKIVNQARKNRKDIIETIINYDEKDITSKRMESLMLFADIIKKSKEKCKKMTIVQLLNYILKEINYENYIVDGTEEGDIRWENVKELFTAVEKYNKMKADEAINLFIEEVALATDLDNVDDNQDTVTLMTLHSAKGLEYDTVFIIGLEEGLLPHSMSIDNPVEMEEERRLCYVGITRAKNRVNLIFARVRRIFGSSQANYPSRFISDIPAHLVDMQNQGYSYLKEDSFDENDIFYD